MLERYVASILTGYIGKYVDNLDRDSLRISVWSGDVSLQNLQLKKDALDAMHLPITADRGTLGSLKLFIPWSRISTEPIKIAIENLLLVTKSRKAAVWFDDIEAKFAFYLKERLLQIFEV